MVLLVAMTVVSPYMYTAVYVAMCVGIVDKVVCAGTIPVAVMFTGAIYCDGSLRTGGFTGEGIAGPSTLVVKTHGLNPRFPTRRLRTDLLFYRAAIFLVRNPRDALVAEWNRERTKQMISNTRSNHYLSADWDQFGK